MYSHKPEVQGLGGAAVACGTCSWRGLLAKVCTGESTYRCPCTVHLRGAMN